MKSVFRVFPIAVVIALVVPAMAPSTATASPVDQQRQHVEDIVDELERLEEQALELGDQYVEAVDSKAELDEEIVAAEGRVAQKEAELTTLRNDLSEMALRSFVGGGGNSLGPLFEDSADLNDVLQRDELARVALSAGDATTDELDAFVADLEAERDTLAAKRRQAEQLADQLLTSQAETERLTGEYTQARADAEATLGELIAEEEARRAAESAARVQAEMAAAAASNSGGGNGGGGGSSNSGSSSGSTSGSNSGGGTSSGGSNSGGSSGGSSGASSGGGSAPAVSSLSGIAVNAAMSQQGVPYRYATSNPGVSFDCSGLTKYAWGQAGVYLPHQSRAQYAALPHVSQSAAQPGDLLFFYSPISHVSVYLGGGMQVHAPNTGSSVKTGSVNWGKVTGVGRPG
jgi:cell wall-associated NlpC family hydrolase